MLSLNNTYSREELATFETRNRKLLGQPDTDLEDSLDYHLVKHFKVFYGNANGNEQSDSQEMEYVVEGKYDGMATSLHYKNGKFEKALSRGDGVHGNARMWALLINKRRRC
jgi:NAD-dependent DNA ligase